MGTLKTKKCAGLHTAPNRLDVPEGALLQANNIIIRKEGVIEPRWGTDLSVANTTVSGYAQWSRLDNFKDYLMFCGYDGSDNNALASVSAAALAAPSVIYTSSGPPSGSSARQATTTPFYDVELLKTNSCLYGNFFEGLIRFDTPASTGFRAGGYPCAVSCSPRPISTGLSRAGSTTVTATTAFVHGYTTGLVVKMSSAGDAHFSAGEYTIVSVPSTTTFTYIDTTDTSTNTLASQTFSANQFVGSSGIYPDAGQAAYRAVIVSYDANGTEYVGEVSGRVEVINSSTYAIGAGANRNAQVAVLFGTAILGNSKVQLYRTKIDTVSPGVEFFKVYEKFLTAAEVTQGFMWITPEACPDTVTSDTLYISPSQQGENHNNSRPGPCKTQAVWGDMLVQGNTLDYPTIQLQLLSTDATAGGLASGDNIQLVDTSNKTLAATDSGTAFNSASRFVRYSGGTASQDVKNTVLSIIDTVNWGMGSAPLSTFNALSLNISGDWPGGFVIQKVVPDQLVTVANRFVVASGTATRACFAPKLGALGAGTAVRTSNVTVVTTAVNHNFTVGEYVVMYTTTIGGTVLQIGGTNVQGQITSVTANTLTFNNTGSDGTGPPVRFITLQYLPVYNENQKVNRIRCSRHRSVEAFPAFTTLDIGQPGAQILKMVPCGTSLMVFKEDGLFRVTDVGGEQEPSLSAQLIDPTCILWAKDSAVAIHNQVIAWLVKGIAVINETGVHQYISEPIYDKLKPVTLQQLPFSRRAFATAVAQEDTYELRIPFSNITAPYASDLNLTYNTFTRTWVQDDLSLLSETVYNGARYMVRSDNALLVQTTSAGIYALNDTPSVTLGSGAYTRLGNKLYSQTYTGSSLAPGTKFTLHYDLINVNITCYCISATAGVLTFYANSVPAVFSNDGSDSITTEFVPVISTIEWAPITFQDEGRAKFFTEGSIFFGLLEAPLVTFKTSSEVIPTQETFTATAFRIGDQVHSPTNDLGTFAPQAVRFVVPQQHRRAQQLRLVCVMTAAKTPWTILGLAITGEGFTPRVAHG